MPHTGKKGSNGAARKSSTAKDAKARPAKKPAAGKAGRRPAAPLPELAAEASQPRAMERGANEVGQALEEVSRETGEVQLRLRALRAEYEEVARELAEFRRRLADARRQLDELEQQARDTRQRLSAQPPAPQPEARPEEPAAPPPVPQPPNRLGVAVEPGVVVAEVAPGSPAAAAGLVAGDVIAAVNGTPVVSGPQLRELIQGAAEGTEVALLVTRGRKLMDAATRLGPAGEAPEGRNRLGVSVDPGVVVAEVFPGTPAVLAGLTPGDVITGVDGHPVATGEEFRRAVQDAPTGEEVRLGVTRGGSRSEVTARLGG